jgi:hypothetical protein
MKSRPNPRRDKGDRNLFCRYYGDCLDYAVKKAWDDWDCGECTHQSSEGGRPEISLQEGGAVAYYELPSEFMGDH